MKERTLRIAEWSALSALGAAGFFQCFSPNLHEIKTEITSGTDSSIADKLDQLRDSYVKAGLWSGVLGIVSSIIAESPIPFLATTATSGAMVATYETALPPNYQLLATVFQPKNYIDASYRILDE